MDYRLSVVIFFKLILRTNARTATADILADKAWFWSILSIVFTLIASICIVLLILSCIHYMKQRSNHRSEGSDLSISDRPVSPYPSPPPSYPIGERPPYLFMTSSPPPPYSALPMKNPVTIIRPADSLDSSSIQTFQA